MGLKAILRLCQVAAGKWVPTWLVVGIGAAWQWTTPASRDGLYLREAHCSHNVRAD